MNGGARNFLLRRLAALTRRCHPRGTERILRLLHDPARSARNPIRTVLPYDRGLSIRIDTGDFIEWSIFFFGHYEPGLSRFLRQNLRPGSRALDIGANIGCHTLIMAAAAGADGQIHAFEPHPEAADRLEANLALNRIRNCRLRREAVGDRPGKALLHAPAGPQSPGVSSLYRANIAGEAREIPVPVTTLDAFAEESGLSSLDLIKIDTEGNELRVIRGGRRLISSLRPLLVFEYSPRTWAAAGESFGETRGLLAEIGYRLELLPGGKGDLSGDRSADLLGRPGKGPKR